MNFASLANEVTQWNEFWIGDVYAEAANSEQSIQLSVATPMDSIVDPYTPVKIKGTFFTRVPRDEATDGAQVFNWVSWTDPRSDSSTNPDVYSLGCTATIDSTSAQNAVRVTNYKGSRSFAKHDWSAQALIDKFT